MGLEGGSAGLSANDVAKIMDGHIEELAEVISKMAIYCPQGSGTLRQQLLIMQGIAWFCIVLHSFAWYCMVLYGIA